MSVLAPTLVPTCLHFNIKFCPKSTEKTWQKRHPNFDRLFDRCFDNLGSIWGAKAPKRRPKTVQRPPKDPKAPKTTPQIVQKLSLNRPWEGPRTESGYARVLRYFGINFGIHFGHHLWIKKSLKIYEQHYTLKVSLNTTNLDPGTYNYKLCHVAKTKTRRSINKKRFL